MKKCDAKTGMEEAAGTREALTAGTENWYTKLTGTSSCLYRMLISNVWPNF